MLDGHKSERGLGTRPGWEQVNLGRLEGQRWGFSLRSERMWAQVYILTRGHMALPAALLSTTATGWGWGASGWLDPTSLVQRALPQPLGPGHPDLALGLLHVWLLPHAAFL